MDKPKNQSEKMAERRDKEISDNAAQLAHALTKTLSRAPFQGKCKCGMMLMESDRIAGKNQYACPRCNRKGEVVPPPAVKPSK